MTQVLKRNGQLEDLDLDKIHHVLEWAIEDINDVNISDIEMNAQLSFKDGISTKEIHQILTRSAADLISENNPNYQYVAARLLLFDLRKEVWGESEPPRLYEHIRSCVQNGHYDSSILDYYSETEIHKINRYVKHNRDKLFTYAGLQQLIDKYLVKNRKTDEVYETPQFAYIMIAMTLFREYPDRMKYIKKAYDYFSKFKISMSTPVMAGVRTNIHSYTSCFTKGNMVWTKSGFKDISKCLSGQVLTHIGNNKNIIAHRTTNFSGELIKLNSVFGFLDEFECTDNHKILGFKRDDIKCLRHNFGVCQIKNNSDICYKKKNRHKSNCSLLNNMDFSPEWIEAKRIEVGDFVHIPYNKDVNYKKLNISDVINIPKNYSLNNGIISRDRKYGVVHDITDCNLVNNDFCRLLGYYLAEGSLGSNNTPVQFTFNINETKYINDVLNISKTLFGIEGKINENTKDNSVKVCLHSKVLGELFITLCGKYSDKKIINQKIMEFPPEKQYLILIGFLRGDGYCNSNNGIAMSIANKNLIFQLAQISLRNGLYPTLNKAKSKQLKREDRKPQYIISFNKTKNFNLIKHVDKFTIVDSKKETYSDGFWYKHEYYSKITKVESNIVENETVYDIQVDEDESFVVNGISVHNCNLLEVDDTMDSILANTQAVGKLISNRAGIGLNMGKVRAIGSEVRGGDVIHTGVIPFLKVYESLVKSCAQGGLRKGSATVNFPFWHYEIEDIIVLKNNAGTDENRVRNVDYCIQFSNLFYDRVKNDEDVTLFSPHEVPELYNLFGTSEFDEYYEKCERKHLKHKKKVNARKLLQQFTIERLETGRIYIMNIDHANNWPWNDKVEMTNLCCLVGDTSIFAIIDGQPSLCKLEELVDIFNNGGKIQVFSYNLDNNTTSFENIENAAYTGEKEIMEIEDTDSGCKIRCTLDHRIWTENRGWVEAQYLKKDDELKII